MPGNAYANSSIFGATDAGTANVRYFLESHLTTLCRVKFNNRPIICTCTYNKTVKEYITVRIQIKSLDRKAD